MCLGVDHALSAFEGLTVSIVREWRFAHSTPTCYFLRKVIRLVFLLVSDLLLLRQHRDRSHGVLRQALPCLCLYLGDLALSQESEGRTVASSAQGESLAFQLSSSEEDVLSIALEEEDSHLFPKHMTSWWR